MKGKINRLKSALILLTVFGFLALGIVSSPRTSAQGIPTPTPSPAPQVSPLPTPNQVGLNLADYLREFVKYTTQVRNSFIRTVEQPLGGWFDNLAWYLAWIIAIVFFLKMIRAEEGAEPSEVMWYVARLSIFLALLWWCGDVNGDGIRGDMTNKFGNWGNSIAYGTVNRQSEPSGSYLGNLVKRERESFNDNYKKFTENKIMVRVNDADMPIRYPDGNEGIRLIAAIYTGSLTPEEEEKVKSQAWQIGACFQFLNVGRAIIEFGDYFLLLLQGFLIIAMRLAAPFMLAVGIDRQLAQRVTYPFLWGTAVVCLVMPVLSQVLRFLAFTAGNLAFGIHSNQPYFVYDPTQKVIVAQGSPEYIILIAGVIMVFMGLTLFASPFLSYRLAQGSFLEGVMSVTSGWFSSLTGIGISAATNYLGTQVGLAAEDLMAQKQAEAKMTEATYGRIAAQQSADAKLQTDMIGAGGRYEGAYTNIMGAFNKEMLGIEAGRMQSQQQAYANAWTQFQNLNADEREAVMRKSLAGWLEADKVMSEKEKQDILNSPGWNNLFRDQTENRLGSTPIVGPVLNQLGFTGGFIDWMRGRQTVGNPTIPNMNETMFKSQDGTAYTFQDFMDKGVLPQLGLQSTQMPNMQLPQLSQIPQMPGITPTQFPPFSTTMPTNMPTTTTNQQNSQNGIPVPLAQDGSLNWDKTTLSSYAAANGYQTFTPTSGNLNETIGVTTEGKTAAQIAGFTAEAQKYGIAVTDNKNGTLTLEDRGWQNPASNTNMVNRANQQNQQIQQMPQQGTISPVGIPANLPKTLLSPLSSKVSSQAAQRQIVGEGQVYYRPEQEAVFQSTGNKYYDSLILGAARTHGINPNLLRAQFYQESGFRRNATSNKGAGGIAQIMPGTAPRLGVTDRYDPAQSVYGGAKYMRYIADYMVTQGGVTDGNRLRALSLAGYNSGEGRVQKSGFNVPRIAETQDYVQRITGNVDRMQRNMPRTNSVALQQDLGRYDKPTQEILSKTYATNFEMNRGLQRNALDMQSSNQITRESYAEKRQITAANMQMQYQISDNYAAMQQQGAYINTAAQMKAAGINYATETQQAQVGYSGAITSANTIYEGQAKSAIIMAEAQMKAARLRALSGAITSLGQTAGHQFSEAFEKFNRF